MYWTVTVPGKFILAQIMLTIKLIIYSGMYLHFLLYCQLIYTHMLFFYKLFAIVFK